MLSDVLGREVFSWRERLATVGPGNVDRFERRIGDRRRTRWQDVRWRLEIIIRNFVDFSGNVRVFLFFEKLILRDYFDCAKYWVG